MVVQRRERTEPDQRETGNQHQPGAKGAMPPKPDRERGDAEQGREDREALIDIDQRKAAETQRRQRCQQHRHQRAMHRAQQRAGDADAIARVREIASAAIRGGHDLSWVALHLK